MLMTEFNREEALKVAREEATEKERLAVSIHFTSKLAKEGMEIKFPMAPPKEERKKTSNALVIRFR
jgi:hypothetical protein